MSTSSTSVGFRRPRPRPASLWSTVLTGATNCSVTVELRRQQRITGKLSSITPEHGIILNTATLEIPVIKNHRPSESSTIMNIPTITLTKTSESNRCIKPLAVSVEWKIISSFDQLTIHSRHVRCVILPASLDVSSALLAQQKKRKKATQMFQRRKLNA